MMSQVHYFLVLVVTACVFLLPLAESSAQTKEPYVVYMGSATTCSGGSGDPETVRATHLQLLSSVIASDEPERLSLWHSYHHAFEGFSALLTQEEAATLSEHERVVSVFRDPVLQLHTTRSWNFLDARSGLQPDRLSRRASGDVIIGVLDTGVWPESPSFNDAGMPEVPSRWRGVCMEGPDFNKSSCNKKLIGARYYDVAHESSASTTSKNASRAGAAVTGGSPRDTVGHGTHTASTAGATVSDASYHGLARGTAKGGAPASRVAVYKVCSHKGCSGSAVLKAIDDAVSDGVDVISISIGIGGGSQQVEFLKDPIALGAFHAHQRGVLVVCSAGNDGPMPYTISNTAPWIFTVAASTMDRAFQSSVILGKGTVVKGVAINFSNQSLSGGRYPIVLGRQVAARHTPVFNSSNCHPGSLDARKVAGKIVVCINTDRSVPRQLKQMVAERAGARGLVLIDGNRRDSALSTGDFPFSQVSTDDGTQILHYINTTMKPTATILPTVDVTGFKPAPVVASFSARGPGSLTETILKPDVMAPGVDILAAAIPSMDNIVPAGKRKPSAFAIRSGTSMACPHVAGAAAFLKSAHPGWSPSMIRSALMTTATTRNNLGKPLTSSAGTVATGHDMGAGEVSPLRALSPGLVFDTTTDDYLNFLCYYGYADKRIRKVSGVARFACPADAPSEDLIATRVNYPSISVPRLRAGKVATVARTVTNVGSSSATTYKATVETPLGLTVHVLPERLVFSHRGATAKFQVSFYAGKNDAAAVSKGYTHGAVTWSDGAHSVRVPFAVHVM